METLPKKIRKRDNSLVAFDEEKIKRAIFRVALEVIRDEKRATQIADVSGKKSLEKVASSFKDKIPSVEEIQDLVEDVRNIYLLAHELKCKGITIYRYGTKKNQVLSFDTRTAEESGEDFDFITAASEYSGGCHSGLCPF